MRLEFNERTMVSDHRLRRERGLNRTKKGGDWGVRHDSRIKQEGPMGSSTGGVPFPLPLAFPFAFAFPAPFPFGISFGRMDGGSKASVSKSFQKDMVHFFAFPPQLRWRYKGEIQCLCQNRVYLV